MKGVLLSGYVEGALVHGASAHILDRVLTSPNVAEALRRQLMPSQTRLEWEAARRAIRRAALAYEALPFAEDGSAAARLAEVGPPSLHEITTDEASALLGVGERRVRQLAAQGMGRRAGGRWLLDRSAVLAEVERRRSA